MKEQINAIEGHYKHYKLLPDGSLELLGDVAYAHSVHPAPDFDTVLRENLGYTAAMSRDAAEAASAGIRKTAEAFEALVDLASESEGGR